MFDSKLINIYDFRFVDANHTSTYPILASSKDALQVIPLKEVPQKRGPFSGTHIEVKVSWIKNCYIQADMIMARTMSANICQYDVYSFIHLALTHQAFEFDPSRNSGKEGCDSDKQIHSGRPMKKQQKGDVKRSYL